MADARLWPNGYGCRCDISQQYIYLGQMMCYNCYQDLINN